MSNTSSYINSINLNIHTNFPYLVLNIEKGNAFPINPGFHVMHWHEDLQLIYVLEGTITVKTLYEEITLQIGEGVFINKNVIHFVEGHKNSSYKSFIFPEYFINFYPNSPTVTLTQNITENQHITLVPLRKEDTGGYKALHILSELVTIEKNKDRLYCYEVLYRLSALWLILLQYIHYPTNVQKDVTHIRMTQFLHYIEAHYQEPITLQALAESANVSQSECLRCFKAVLQTTPYRYVIDFRLLQAATLLKTSRLPISQISMVTGFQQQSYFAKCFKEKMNCTPREYRANKDIPLYNK